MHGQWSTRCDTAKAQTEDQPTRLKLEEYGWTLDQALDDFTRRTHAALIDAQKTPLVWQEMVRTSSTIEAGELGADIARCWIMD
jgi:hypothetical protein